MPCVVRKSNLPQQVKIDLSSKCALSSTWSWHVGESMWTTIEAEKSCRRNVRLKTPLGPSITCPRPNKNRKQRLSALLHALIRELFRTLRLNFHQRWKMYSSKGSTVTKHLYSLLLDDFSRFQFLFLFLFFFSSRRYVISTCLQHPLTFFLEQRGSVFCVCRSVPQASLSLGSI